MIYHRVLTSAGFSSLNFKVIYLIKLHIAKYSYRGTFRTFSNIYEGVSCENSQRLLVVDYFCKTRFIIHVCQGPN